MSRPLFRKRHEGSLSWMTREAWHCVGEYILGVFIALVVIAVIGASI